MTTWRAPATVAVAVLIGSAAPIATTWAQPAPSSTATTPITPVDDELAPEDGVVHSWALSPAGSADGGGSRPNLSYEVAPGSVIDDQVTLFNFGNVQLTFRIYATDAVNNEDGAFDVLPGDERPRDVGTWVAFPQGSITLPPRSQATLPITIKVPVTARPGDHAGAVLAASRAEGTGPDGKLVALDRRTGSRLYVRVTGPLTPELAVAAIRTSYKPSLNPLSGTADVTYRVENRGNVRMGGTHRVAVGGPFGIGTRRAKPVTLPELLPGEHVTLQASLEGVPAALLAVTKIELDPAPVGVGVEDQPSRSRSSLTYAVPFSVLALVAVGVLVRRARRSYVRHRLEEPNAGTLLP